MSAARYLARAAAPLLVAACFNPTGQVDTSDTLTSTTSASTTIDTGSSTTATATGTTVETTSSATSDATATTTTGTSGTTTAGGGCGDEPDPNGYCLAVDPKKPFCDLEGGVCAECVAKEDCGSNGVCDVDAGVCVDCVEDLDCPNAEAPACDPATKTCGCTEHDQCPATACELDVGTCFPPALTAVVHVRPSMGPECPQNDLICDAIKPCCSIDAALDNALTMGKAYVVVRVEPGVGDMPDHAFDFPGAAIGKRIAILGEGEPVIESATGAPAIFINQAIKFYGAGLRLRAVNMGMAGAGLSCYTSTGAWIDDVVIESFANGVGLFTAACPMQARRVQIRAVKGGAWASAGGSMRLVNTTIAEPKDYALKGDMGGTMDVVFSTITERSGISGHLLTCTGAGTKILARNSALLANPEAGSSACAGAKVSNSVVTDVAFQGATVTVIAQGEVAPLFVDWLGGDLHVLPSATVLDGVASREAGDPVTDLDREVRPLTIGASDWAGADRP